MFDVIDKEITKLGVEHDEKGNRAKAYLYCLETRCPETGWVIPLSPSWVISPKQGAVAKLIPDEKNKRFDIEVVSCICSTDQAADKGTVQDGDMKPTLNGRTYRSPIKKPLRGDFRDADGNTGNRLRRWEKDEFRPRPDDISFRSASTPSSGLPRSPSTLRGRSPISPR